MERGGSNVHCFADWLARKNNLLYNVLQMPNPITSIRLDSKLRKQIEQIAKELGLHFSDIVQLALRAIANGEWQIGVTRYPPKYIEAIHKETGQTRALRKKGKLKGYKSGKNLINDILSE